VYTEFYNLEEKPFNLTPSPRFLYLGESHKEALALLTYGVVERKGFILLTGEVGTGKTTMVQALLSNLDKNVQYISLTNPLLSPEDFVDYLAFSVFGKKVHLKSKAVFLLEFEEYLRECLQHQRNVILIIDEAHKLSFELLEEIRLLSNMESADEKLINIFLIGQPELNEKLSEARCRPLLQRISSRFHIPPLDLAGTREYMMNRLKIAGAKDVDAIFPKSTVKAIHQCSGGYPRMINILADNGLLLGYSEGKKKITAAMIQQCSDDLDLEGSFLKRDDKEKEGPPQTDIPEKERVNRYWKWAAVFLFMMAMLALGVSHVAKNSEVVPVSPNQVPLSDSEATKEQAPLKKNEIQVEREIPAKSEIKEQVSPASRVKEISGDSGNMTHVNGMEREESSLVKEIIASSDMGKPEGTGEKMVLPREEGEMSFKSLIVKDGDTLARLVEDVYGRADKENMNLVQKHNPEITDINRIMVGQKIIFPLLVFMHQNATFTVHVASFKFFEDARAQFQDLTEKGYDVYVLPKYIPGKGRIFRVTIGNFKGPREAEDFADVILKKGVSDYAKPIRLDEVTEVPNRQ